MKTLLITLLMLCSFAQAGERVTSTFTITCDGQQQAERLAAAYMNNEAWLHILDGYYHFRGFSNNRHEAACEMKSVYVRDLLRPVSASGFFRDVNLIGVFVYEAKLLNGIDFFLTEVRELGKAF